MERLRQWRINEDMKKGLALQVRTKQVKEQLEKEKERAYAAKVAQDAIAAEAALAERELAKMERLMQHREELAAQMEEKRRLKVRGVDQVGGGVTQLEWSLNKRMRGRKVSTCRRHLVGLHFTPRLGVSRWRVVDVVCSWVRFHPQAEMQCHSAPRVHVLPLLRWYAFGLDTCDMCCFFFCFGRACPAWLCVVTWLNVMLVLCACRRVVVFCLQVSRLWKRSCWLRKRKPSKPWNGCGTTVKKAIAPTRHPATPLFRIPRFMWTLMNQVQQSCKVSASPKLRSTNKNHMRTAFPWAPLPSLIEVVECSCISQSPRHDGTIRKDKSSSLLCKPSEIHSFTLCFSNLLLHLLRFLRCHSLPVPLRDDGRVVGMEKLQTLNSTSHCISHQQEGWLCVKVFTTVVETYRRWHTFGW